MATTSVCYIVNDVDAAVAFYTRQLGFQIDRNSGYGFARITRGDLALLLNTPGGGGDTDQGMPDGRRPEPGGWNRIQLEVEDLVSVVDRLKREGARFRNDVVFGKGGKQILVEDPAGNPIELFTPRQVIRHTNVRFTCEKTREIQQERRDDDGEEPNQNNESTRKSPVTDALVLAAERADRCQPPFGEV